MSESNSPVSLLWLRWVSKPNAFYCVTFGSNIYRERNWGCLGILWVVLGKKLSFCGVIERHPATAQTEMVLHCHTALTLYLRRYICVIKGPSGQSEENFVMVMVAGPCYAPMSVLGTCSIAFICLGLAAQWLERVSQRFSGVTLKQLFSVWLCSVRVVTFFTSVKSDVTALATM